MNNRNITKQRWWIKIHVWWCGSQISEKRGPKGRDFKNKQFSGPHFTLSKSKSSEDMSGERGKTGENLLRVT